MDGLSLVQNLIDHYEERAAIIEYDAGQSRATAEARALREVREIAERLYGKDKAIEIVKGIKNGNR
jgi:hypothetical protein